MKLLYSFIICCFIQMVISKPSTDFPNSKTNAFRIKLVELYDNELDAIDKRYCEKAKVLSKKLLQDKVVKQAATPILKQFKQNITDYLNEYPSYQRYGLINLLVLLFEDRIPQPSNNKDINYIWQLLKKHGYKEMDDEYESRYMKFVKQKFLPKFEELKKQLSQQELKQQKVLLNWFKELKKCQNYNCMLKYLNKLEGDDYTPKDNLFEYIVESVDNIQISYGNTANNMSKAVLKDQRLSQLPKSLRLNLTNDIKHFIKVYKKHKDVNELYSLLDLFDVNVLWKYYFNTTLPLKEQKLIVQIFDAHDCAKLIAEYSRKLHGFVDRGLFEKFKQFKAALTPKQLAKEKPLLQWYDRLKVLHTPDDIMEALDNLDNLVFLNKI